MKIEIKELEKKFDSTIWQRGKEYYTEGLIGNVIKSGNRIKAESYGNSTYRLEVDLKEMSMKCSCPCDFNCKHLAALIIWLKNNKIADLSEQVSFLNSMTKSELVSILGTILEKYPDMTIYTQTLDDNAIKDLIKKLWFPRNGDNISLFNKLDFIKKFVLRKQKFDLLILFLRKLIDMFNHDADSNELMDYIDEFLYGISKIKLTKEKNGEIRKIIKDYPFDY